MTMRENRVDTARGFTMVEMVVSIGLFMTLMLIITGSFLSIMDAARKTRSSRIALDNIGASVDYMAREIRLGMYFRCENDAGAPSINLSDITTTADCDYPTGGNILAFEHAGGGILNQNDQYVFKFENGQIFRSKASGAVGSWEELTSADLQITYFRFFVDGTTYSVGGAPADQPRITVVIRGTTRGKVKSQVQFGVQTTLSARTPNVPSS